MTETVIIRDEPLRQRAIDLIRALNVERVWEVTVKRHRKRRTLSQNGLYWMWMTEVEKHVSEHTGHNKDELHQIFKQMFLTPKIVEVFGEPRQVYPSTRDLSTAEMAEYCEKIDRLCASELGIFLPKPEEMQQR